MNTNEIVRCHIYEIKLEESTMFIKVDLFTLQCEYYHTVYITLSKQNFIFGRVKFELYKWLYTISHSTFAEQISILESFVKGRTRALC